MIRLLGPSNCALSIVEGRSRDGTYEILKTLGPTLSQDLPDLLYYFTTNAVDPKGGTENRIVALAALRDQALSPMYNNHSL